MQNILPIAILSLTLILLSFLKINDNTQVLLRRKNQYSALIGIMCIVQSLFYINYLFQPALEIRLLTFNNFGISFEIRSFSALFSLVAVLIQYIVLRYSINYLKTEGELPRFLIHTVLAGMGLQGLFLSNNLVSSFLFILLISYSSNKLIGYYRSRSVSKAVGTKHKIIDSIANLFLLVSFLLFGAITKSGNIEQIQSLLQNDTTIYGSFGILFLLLGSFIKAAQFPFHNWLGEVMEAPTPVSALLHAGIIGVGPFLLHSFSKILYSSNSALITIICFSSLSILIGAFSFYYQKGIKNLLAYSSIAHLGFTLFLFGIGFPGASLLHFSGHAFYKAHAFLSSGSELERKRSKSFYVPSNRNNYLGLLALISTPIAIWILAEYTILLDWFNPEMDLALFIGLTIGTLFSNTLSNGENWKYQFNVLLLGCISFFAFLLFERFFSDFQLHAYENKMVIQSRWLILSFFSLLLIYGQLKRLQFIKPLFPNLEIHLQHGLYIPILVNRIYSNLISSKK